jgi:hypothetical protein
MLLPSMTVPEMAPESVLYVNSGPPVCVKPMATPLA